MKIGYSFWGFWGIGIVDTPDGGREISLHYLVGEFLWYERVSNLLNEISCYSRFWNKISDNGINSNSSY